MVESVTTSAQSAWSSSLRHRSRSRSRSAALHCLTVPEEDDGGGGDEQDDCYDDWYVRTTLRAPAACWTSDQVLVTSSSPSTPIKTATLRSVLRSSINSNSSNNGDDLVLFSH